MDELQLIQSRIYEIRGQKVMLDFDLAEMYEVETRALNQAVKRNIERFPEDFMFQLTKEETLNWKSQIVMSNSIKMGMRRSPYAFTELGVAMLSSVLNSKAAIQIRLQRIKFGPLKREADTVLAMVRIYCHAHHSTKGDNLCSECQELADYAFKRLSCCPFKEDKPVCAKCKVHCYKPAYREKISEVMRFAGPRVMFKHPILSLEHLWKSLTVTPPEKPRGKPKKVTPIREVPTVDNAATKGDRP